MKPNVCLKLDIWIVLTIAGDSTIQYKSGNNWPISVISYYSLTTPYSVRQYRSLGWAETSSWTSLVVHDIEELNKHAWPEPNLTSMRKYAYYANICGYRQTACKSKPMLSANALSQPLLTSGDVMYILTAVYAVQYTQRWNRITSTDRLWESCIQLKTHGFPVLLEYNANWPLCLTKISGSI